MTLGAAARATARIAAAGPRKAATPTAMVKGAVLGVDVSKSRSPAIHQAAFRALKIDGSYVAHSVTARQFRGLVGALAAEGFRYVNVTIPHKHAAAALATSRSAAVKSAGAANTLIFTGGRKDVRRKDAGGKGRRQAVTIRAENTDGPGLLAALRDLGAEPKDGIAVVVGSGGAAAGAVEALTAAGARVRIVARRPRAARLLRARLPARRRSRVTVVGWQGRALAQAIAGAGMLISAVPAAAWGEAAACDGLQTIDRGTAVLEMAYGAETPLAHAVRGRVSRYADGLGMLVHQAAVAITLALGQPPPLPPLFRAVRAAR